MEPLRTRLQHTDISGEALKQATRTCRYIEDAQPFCFDHRLQAGSRSFIGETMPATSPSQITIASHHGSWVELNRDPVHEVPKRMSSATRYATRGHRTNRKSLRFCARILHDSGKSIQPKSCVPYPAAGCIVLVVIIIVICCSPDHRCHTEQEASGSCRSVTTSHLMVDQHTTWVLSQFAIHNAHHAPKPKITAFFVL